MGPKSHPLFVHRITTGGNLDLTAHAEVQAHAFIILCHQYPTPSPLMFVVCYSQGFNIFFSPLWEMVQDGIDLKSIKWTQH
jgi:hypothetical protein